MEYVSGITLEERVRQAGALELKEVLRVGMQVAGGLAAAHKQGLVHRDIKPANILLENGIHRVKITDFGLAGAAEAGLMDGTVIAGTPLYMSPEQARGQPTDQRSDLFSLGSVLYTLCAGRPPFQGDTAAVLKGVREDSPPPLREIRPDVPGWLCDVIATLQAKEARDRFASAQELADLLRGRLAALQQPSTAPPPDAPKAVPVSPSRRWRVVVALGLAALVLALAALVALLLAGQRPGPSPGPGTDREGPGVAAPLDLQGGAGLRRNRFACADPGRRPC
jgi:serine/threonine protein kinase